jgi:hypothetical protein
MVKKHDEVKKKFEVLIILLDIKSFESKKLHKIISKVRLIYARLFVRNVRGIELLTRVLK